MFASEPPSSGSPRFERHLTPLPLDMSLIHGLPTEIHVCSEQLRQTIHARGSSPELELPTQTVAACLQVLAVLDPPWLKMIQDRVAHRAAGKDLREWSHYQVEAFLLRLFRVSWSVETTSALHRNGFARGHPSSGQAAPTALIVHDLLGGRLLAATADGHGHHFWNIRPAPGNEHLDLTREQFQCPPMLLFQKLIDRAYLTTSDYAVAAEVPARYALLRQRVGFAAAALALLCAMPHEV